MSNQYGGILHYLESEESSKRKERKKFEDKVEGLRMQEESFKELQESIDEDLSVASQQAIASYVIDVVDKEIDLLKDHLERLIEEHEEEYHSSGIKFKTTT